MKKFSIRAYVGLAVALAACCLVDHVEAQQLKTRASDVPIQGDSASINVPVAQACAGTIDPAPLDPNTRWVLGIREMWFDFEGLNLEALAYNSPLLRLNERADRRGRQYYLERYDVITHIDGRPISSLEDYVYALQGAKDPRNLAIAIINGRDGQRMTLYGSAMKVRF